PHVEPGPHCVEGGGPHAVVGGDAGDVHRVDVPAPEVVGQTSALGVDALEAGVRGVVLPLVEHVLDRAGVEVRMELDTGRAHDTVRGPAVAEVGLGGEVTSRVDVVVTGRDDGRVVPAMVVHEPADAGRGRGSAV